MAREEQPARSKTTVETKLMKIWHCKIGECLPSVLPPGADVPMREAIARAYREITGNDPDFIFSGWGGELTEGERAVVEDRMPVS